MHSSVRRSLQCILLLRGWRFLVFALIGCSSALQVRDVIDLPPPRHVRAVQAGAEIKVSWESGVETESRDFRGYLLYVSPRSLMTVPLAAMPEPIEVQPGVTEYTITVFNSAPVFIHVRSRAGRREVSVPSLPELIVRPE